MKKLTILYLLLMLCLSVFSQNMAPIWETCLGGSEWDEGKGIIEVESIYYIISVTESNDGDISYNHGIHDIWLTSIGQDGTILSEKTFGGSRSDGGFIDIKKVNDSTFYIIGITASVDGDISYNPWPEYANIWILQINKAGDILWESVHGGSLIDWTRDMEVTDDGGLLTLSLSNSPDGDVSNPNGSDDLWLLKLNKNGEKEWDFSLGSTSGEEGGSVIQTEDGGFIVIGNTEGDFGGNYDTTCNFHGFVDVWVVKLDSLRNIEWQQTYGGSQMEGGLNILETEDGYICLAITLSNDGDVYGFHGVPGNLQYGDDIWVFKIDKSGNLLWQNCLGGLYAEWARNIFPTTDGGYMIVGITQSDDGDVEGFNGGDTGGYDDIWFAKIDSLGQLAWQYCYGGFGTEYLYRGVCQKSDYDYVLALGTKTDDWQCNINTAKPDLRIVELYDSTVSIVENKPKNMSVEVYPNPTNGGVNFKYMLPAGQTKGMLIIYNNTGQLVRNFSIMANQGQIIYNTGSLPSGIYYYKFVSGKLAQSGKIIIK